MNGKVKFFHHEKNFGFIAGDDGKEYFVHASALGEGVTVNENDEVTFDVEEGDRGPKAVNVRRGSSEEAAPAPEAEASEELTDDVGEASDDSEEANR